MNRKIKFKVISSVHLRSGQFQVDHSSKWEVKTRRRIYFLKCIRQYAYVPTDPPHTNPKTFQKAHQLQNDSEVLLHNRNQGQSAMVPATSRFIPALGSKSNSQFSSKGIIGFPRQTNMGPPPTPQRFHPPNSLLTKSKSTNHLVPPSSHRQKSQIFSTSNPSLRGSSLQPHTARGEHRMSFDPQGSVNQQGSNWL